jgi:hypothetical protein
MFHEELTLFQRSSETICNRSNSELIKDKEETMFIAAEKQ